MTSVEHACGEVWRERFISVEHDFDFRPAGWSRAVSGILKSVDVDVGRDGRAGGVGPLIMEPVKVSYVDNGREDGWISGCWLVSIPSHVSYADIGREPGRVSGCTFL